MPQPVIPPGRSRHFAGSLLASAEVVNEDGRWAHEGVSFRADPCHNSGYVTFCGPEEGQDDKAINDSGTLWTFDSFFFWEGDRCSAVGTRDREQLAARLTAKLERNTSHRIESRFESTVLATNTAAGGVALAVIPGPLGLVEAVYALAAILNDVLVGDRGMIHVPQALVAYLDFYGLVTRPGGNTLQLANSDHAIVTGTGYVGLSPNPIPDGDPVVPDQGFTNIYATSPVAVRLSSIKTFANTVAGNLDRDNNQLEVRAERAAVAYFDKCAWYYANVCLPDPGPECVVAS